MHKMACSSIGVVRVMTLGNDKNSFVVNSALTYRIAFNSTDNLALRFNINEKRVTEIIRCRFTKADKNTATVFNKADNFLPEIPTEERCYLWTVFQ